MIHIQDTFQCLQGSFVFSTQILLSSKIHEGMKRLSFNFFSLFRSTGTFSPDSSDGLELVIFQKLVQLFGFVERLQTLPLSMQIRFSWNKNECFVKIYSRIILECPDIWTIIPIRCTWRQMQRHLEDILHTTLDMLHNQGYKNFFISVDEAFYVQFAVHLKAAPHKYIISFILPWYFCTERFKSIPSLLTL